MRQTQSKVQEMVRIEVPLTEDDMNPAKVELRRAETLARIKAPRNDRVILDGVTLERDETWYPADSVVTYNSKAILENRCLGNHYECIVRFRGIEFYGWEQLHSALKFNQRPYILNAIMSASSATDAKQRSHDYALDGYCLYDSDYNEKDLRISALCQLMKYLSVPEYRERLRELRGRTLVEKKGKYEHSYLTSMNAERTHYIGTGGGNILMAVRDMMARYEDEAIESEERKKGAPLSPQERDAVLDRVLEDVRSRFENDPQVRRDSDNVVEYIKSHPDIIPLKRYWPQEGSKALVLEFDNCVFDTSADYEVRQRRGAKPKFNAAYYKTYVPEFRLYGGWAEVFDWASENNVLIGVLGRAKAELVKKTFDHNGLRLDAVGYMSKPDYLNGYGIMDKLKVRPSQVIYVGRSELTRRQAAESNVRFIGALWGDDVAEDVKKGETIGNPKELIDILKSFDPKRQKV